MPIYYYTAAILVRPGLEGAEPNLLNRIDFGRLRWRRPRASPAEGAAVSGAFISPGAAAFGGWEMRLVRRVREDGGAEGRR